MYLDSITDHIQLKSIKNSMQDHLDIVYATLRHYLAYLAEIPTMYLCQGQELKHPEECTHLLI